MKVINGSLFFKEMWKVLHINHLLKSGPIGKNMWGIVICLGSKRISFHFSLNPPVAPTSRASWYWNCREPYWPVCLQTFVFLVLIRHRSAHSTLDTSTVVAQLSGSLAASEQHIHQNSRKSWYSWGLSLPRSRPYYGDCMGLWFTRESDSTTLRKCPVIKFFCDICPNSLQMLSS